MESNSGLIVQQSDGSLSTDESDIPLHLPSIVDVGIDDPEDQRTSLTRTQMLILCLSVMLGGAFNNVLGKIRAKPLGACNYLVSIMNAIAYSSIYFVILKFRKYRGSIGQDEVDFVWKTRPSRHATHHTSSSLHSLSQPLLSDSNTVPSSSSWQRLRDYVHRLGAWKYFVVSGFCDFSGNIVAMIAQPYIPGPLFALVNQATLPAATAVSYVLLRKRYSICQLLAIVCVWTGGGLALLPELIKLISGPNESRDESRKAAMTIHYSLLVVLGTIPTALSSAVKEKVFKLYNSRRTKACKELRERESVRALEGVGEHRSNGEQKLVLRSSMRDRFEHNPINNNNMYKSIKTLDVFIISAYGSIFQLIFVPLAFPINMMVGQFGSHSLLALLHAGVLCLFGVSSGDGSLCHALPNPSLGVSPILNNESCLMLEEPCEDYGCCRWAPISYLPYLVVNVIFNVLLLFLIVHGSAVVAFMTLKAILPLAILLFALFNWPLLNHLDTEVSPNIFASLICVCVGIWWYRQASQKSSSRR